MTQKDNHARPDPTLSRTKVLIVRHDDDCPAAEGDGTLCRCTPEIEALPADEYLRRLKDGTL